jgi:hypothetical protein
MSQQQSPGTSWIELIVPLATATTGVIFGAMMSLPA